MALPKKNKCKNCGKPFTPEFGRWNTQYCKPKCREEVTEKRRLKNNKKNKEVVRDRAKKHYHDKVKNNPKAREEFSDRSKKYREDNMAKVKLAQKKYYEKNKKKIQERRRKWWDERGKDLAKARKEGRQVNLLKRGRPRAKKKV